MLAPFARFVLGSPPAHRPRSRQFRGLARTGMLAFALCGGCSKQDEDPGSATAAQAPQAPSGLIRVGQPAPEFEAVAHSGQPVKLSDLRGKVVILYFYPKDGTPGCTKEATGFRDEHQDLDAAGAVVLGVSSQDNESHREFAERYSLPFLLIPDEDLSIAERYGVGSILGFSKRVTFLIDRQGRVAQVYDKVSPPGHAAEILQDVRQLPPAEETHSEKAGSEEAAADSPEAITPSSP